MKKNKKTVLFILIVLIIGVVLIVQNPFYKKEAIPRELQDAWKSLICGTNSVGNENTGLDIGQQAPDFILQSVDDNNVQLSRFRGKKAVVVNFWATWCPPCREEMPAFEAIYLKNKEKLEILGINLQESERAINNFLKAVPVTYPLLLDPDGNAKKKYNVFTQPVTYFIDKEGIIVEKKFGPLTEQEMEDKFNKIGMQ